MQIETSIQPKQSLDGAPSLCFRNCGRFCTEIGARRGVGVPLGVPWGYPPSLASGGGGFRRVAACAVLATCAVIEQPGPLRTGEDVEHHAVGDDDEAAHVSAPEKGGMAGRGSGARLRCANLAFERELVLFTS